MSLSTGLAAVNLGLNVVQGALSASANRQQARAQMTATRQEMNYNLGVMRQNKIDSYASNLLSSWGSGIDPLTGSTNAVIQSNQAVLQDEINFQEQQYNTQLKNLKAQSKQKYLGIF